MAIPKWQQILNLEQQARDVEAGRPPQPDLYLSKADPEERTAKASETIARNSNIMMFHELTKPIAIFIAFGFILLLVRGCNAS